MKGQSLVEFAIGLVLILVVLTGLAELGIALFQKVQLSDAAQEGAQFASYCQDIELIKERAVTSSSSPILLEKHMVAVESSETEVKVSVRYPHKVFTPFGSVFFGEYINLESYSVSTIMVNKCP